MKPIYTKNAPEAVGSYSQAMVSGGLVYTSGQIGLDPVTGAMAGDTLQLQTEQVMKNLAAVLAAAGSGMDRVIKTTCFLENMEDFASFNEIYAAYFPKKPARSCVAAKKLPKGALVEVEVVAEV